jgi:hypothetical protein
VAAETPHDAQSRLAELVKGIHQLLSPTRRKPDSDEEESWLVWEEMSGFGMAMRESWDFS